MWKRSSWWVTMARQTYEKEMEQPLKDYFIRKGMNGSNVAVQSEKIISLDFMNKSRRPDVYGIKNRRAGKYEIYMVEAKLSPTNFSKAMEQLRELRGYANYLYSAFLKQEWENSSDYDKGYIKREFKKSGFGVLLVDPSKNKVESFLKPKTNGYVREHKKTKIKEAFAPPFPDISTPKYRGFLKSRSAGCADELLWFSLQLMERIRDEIRGVDPKLKNMKIHTDSISINRSTIHYMSKYKYKRFQYRIYLDTFGTLEGDKIPQLSVGMILSKNELEEMNNQKRAAFDQFTLGKKRFNKLGKFTTYLWFMNKRHQLLHRPSRLWGHSTSRKLDEMFRDPSYGGAKDAAYIGVYKSIDISNRNFEDIVEDVELSTSAVNEILKRLKKKR